jgi:hypothetical protein
MSLSLKAGEVLYQLRSALDHMACLLIPRAAVRCPPIPVCSSLWTADVVFVGLVTNVARPTRGTEMTRFSVEEWFRGERVGKEATSRLIASEVPAIAASTKANATWFTRIVDPTARGAWTSVVPRPPWTEQLRTRDEPARLERI